ncbi:NIF-domain-containing protein [Suillus paluster]|uniref:NIF-domain-containing protein n=1 Tax=Suillus paluster TaxID=48578 RepID=UPI001B85B756|nr:NIF-domain-containing protein [Suillus paluster]KAG1753982.1 NIF-domain-containing protein [Suillus paluster]
MNSLTYISRQFDVFVSARTPPSTPVDDKDSYFLHRALSTRRGSDSGTSFKRTNSWTKKSQPQGPDLRCPPRPKRSYSSPSGFFPIPILRPFPPPPPADVAIHSKSRFRVRSVLRRLFLVRAFVLVWNTLCATWAQWTPGEIETKGKQESVGERPEEPLGEATDVLLLEIHLPSPSILSPPSPDIPSHVLQVIPSKPDIATLPTPPPSPGPSHPSSQHLPRVPPTTVTDTASRSPTPTLTATHKTPFHLPKTLVLDLDETLIHSTSKPMCHSSSGSGLLGFGRRNKGHTVEVVLGGRSTLYHVYKRPFVDYFLRKVSSWYTLVVFTASMQEYADPVIDWLDAGRGILARRLFRESCTQLPNGSYIKDLSIVEQDLSRVCLIDNSPVSYRGNEANGIPIEGWTHDPLDEALLDLLPILDSLRFTGDVRRVLGIRGFSS